MTSYSTRQYQIEKQEDNNYYIVESNGNVYSGPYSAKAVAVKALEKALWGEKLPSDVETY